MKNKLKIVSFLLLMSILNPINSMKGDRDENYQEENKEDQKLKKQKQESTGQEVFNHLNFNNNNLPVEVIINILEYSLTEIINKSDIFNWVEQVERFANNMSLVNENFRDAIDYIIKKGYDKKIAKNRFASDIKINNITFLNAELKRKITGNCDNRAKLYIAKLIISGADPREILTVDNGMNLRPLTVTNNPKWAQLSNLLIKYDPDIKAFPDLKVIIHFASKTGNLSLIRKLIKSNIVIDDDALQAALINGNYQLIKLLISNRHQDPAVLNYLSKLESFIESIDLTSEDDEGNTPLLLAIKKGHIVLIEKLIEFKKRDSYINIKNNNGQTPLMLAADKGYAEIVKLLLAHNVNVDDVNINGWTALMFAANEDNTEVVKLLLDHNVNVNIVGKNGWTALMLAAFNGHTEIAKLLLAHNANIDAVDINDWTALIWASFQGHTEIVELLLAHNANVDAANKVGRTALIVASNQGHVKRVELLLAHNANVNIVDKGGHTPLRYVASHGWAEIAELLLAHKAISVDAVDKNGNTALMIAVSHGHIEVVRRLILAGADVNIRNYQNKSAKDLAIENNNQSIVNLLDDYEKSI